MKARSQVGKWPQPKLEGIARAKLVGQVSHDVDELRLRLASANLPARRRDVFEIGSVRPDAIANSNGAGLTTYIFGSRSPEPVPPKPNCFMTDVDLALVRKVFDVPERKGGVHK